MPNRNTRKGFTLTEILVALAIFALGGTAIMALFITNVRLSRQAMDYTRAAEITRNVRSLMTQSLSRPHSIGDENNVYAFYYPGTQVNFNPDRYRDQYEGGGGYDKNIVPQGFGENGVEQTLFFRLPKQRFDAGSMNYFDPNQQLTVIPRDALTASGSKATFQNEDGDPKVFGFLPDKLRQAGALDGLDPDDRMFYQFDVSIRRSVQRASVDDAAGSGAKQPLEDLYVVHVRIYKGFDFTDNIKNDPYFEWDFYVNAAQ